MSLDGPMCYLSFIRDQENVGDKIKKPLLKSNQIKLLGLVKYLGSHDYDR